MTTTDTAATLISLSIDEDRIVAEYPDTRAEYDALLDALMSASVGTVDTAQVSGGGYSGRESTGYTDIWSDDGWRVHLYAPADER